MYVLWCKWIVQIEHTSHVEATEFAFALTMFCVVRPEHGTGTGNVSCFLFLLFLLFLGTSRPTKLALRIGCYHQPGVFVVRSMVLSQMARDSTGDVGMLG